MTDWRGRDDDMAKRVERLIHDPTIHDPDALRAFFLATTTRFLGLVGELEKRDQRIRELEALVSAERRDQRAASVYVEERVDGYYAVCDRFGQGSEEAGPYATEKDAERAVARKTEALMLELQGTGGRPSLVVQEGDACWAPGQRVETKDDGELGEVLAVRAAARDGEPSQRVLVGLSDDRERWVWANEIEAR